MGEQDNKVFWEAVRPPRIRHGSQQMAGAKADFAGLLRQAQSVLAENSITFSLPPQGEAFEGATFHTPVGQIKVSFVPVMSDGYIVPAALFVDQPPLEPVGSQRLLLSVVLGLEQDWTASNGVNLTNAIGQLSSLTVVNMISAAMAERLRLNSGLLPREARSG